MKAVLRQEPWQVVARDTPWNVGVGLTDKIGVTIAQCFQSAVDFTASAVIPHLIGKLVVIGFSDAHPRAIIHQDIELLDVVIGFARHHGMNAARIVTDHSSERAMIVRRGIWTEGEMIAFRRIAEIVEYDAGLDAGALLGAIEIEKAMHVLGQIHDPPDVTALTGETDPAAPRQNGRAIMKSRRN